MKKAVMFDFDGVLVDTLFITYSINKEAGRSFSLEQFKACFENSFKILKSDGSHLVHPKFNELYQKKTRELKIPTEIKESIKNLAKSFILVIISSTDSSLIKEILEREGISSYFNEILGNDIDINKINKINNTLKRYDLSPNETVYITDTSGDVKEAESCGVKSIAVTWGYHERETLEKANPEVIIDDPQKLTETIKKVLK